MKPHVLALNFHPMAAPSNTGLEDIERIAARAFADIPDALRLRCENVALHVQDFPDADIQKDLNLESPFDLLGLYQGVSLAEKSVMDAPADQDRVFLYRRPILDYHAETGEPLARIVRHVLIHEIGHHFGLSDADMEAIECGADT